jgi:hypothetical protein
MLAVVSAAFAGEAGAAAGALVNGFFAGTSGERAGIRYHSSHPDGSIQIIGAAGFEKN